MCNFIAIFGQKLEVKQGEKSQFFEDIFLFEILFLTYLSSENCHEIALKKWQYPRNLIFHLPKSAIL